MRALMLMAGLGMAMLQAAPLDDTATARKKYDALSAKVLAGDLAIDWRELRLAAVVAGVDGNFDWRDQDKKAQAAFNAGKYDEALKLSLPITAHNIANLNGHFDVYIAYKHLDRSAEADRESKILNALLKSIDASGDGKSAATAYFTVDPSEEYIYLELVAHLQPSGQALVHQDGHDYDKMTAKDDAGKETTVWFNTDTDMQMTKRAFGGK